MTRLHAITAWAVDLLTDWPKLPRATIILASIGALLCAGSLWLLVDTGHWLGSLIVMAAAIACMAVAVVNADNVPTDWEGL
jgi:hypothetical protein